MVYCPKCGTPNQDTDAFCRNCGNALRAAPPGAPLPGAAPSPDGLGGQDKTLIFLGNLCISPVLGLALYLIWKDKKPLKAKETCTLTWWSVGAWALLFILAIGAAILIPVVARLANGPM